MIELAHISKGTRVVDLDPGRETLFEAVSYEQLQLI